MPQATFLDLLSADEGLQRTLAQPNLEELFAVAAASPSPRTPSRTVLRDWASHQLSEAAAQQQVLVIPPGEHSFGPRPAGCGGKGRRRRRRWWRRATRGHSR